MSGLTQRAGRARPGRLREELLGDRRPPLHVQGAPGRAQDAGAQAIEKLFDVHVERVNIVKVQAKPKRRGLFKGTRPGWKKAIVQVREGETIEIFEGARSNQMAVKKYKPTSAGRRQMATSSFEEITRTEPEKSLLEPLHKKGGRNNHGRITTRHQGGGHKRRYRRIDFKRVKDGVPAKVASIEYDPNRSARIALLHYADGAKAYILAPAGLRVGATVQSGTGADIKPGNALPLDDIPTGTIVHAVELKPGQGAKMARSAGSGVQLVAKDAPLRRPAAPVRRDAPRAAHVPRDRRPGRELPTTRTSRAARRAAAAGSASARPCAARP